MHVVTPSVRITRCEAYSNIMLRVWVNLENLVWTAMNYDFSQQINVCVWVCVHEREYKHMFVCMCVYTLDCTSVLDDCTQIER